MTVFTSRFLISFSILFLSAGRLCYSNLKFVNVPDLNKVLRSEVFISEDRKLRAVYLILDFMPLSNKFQEVGNAIRAGDPWLARIDVSVLGFLAREGTVQVELSPLLGSP